MLLLRCVAHGQVRRTWRTRTAAGRRTPSTWRPRTSPTLAELRFPAHPLLGEARAQVTQIQGGLARNQVPDKCEFFVDLRTTPGMDHAAVATQLAEVLRSEVAVHSARYLPKATAPSTSPSSARPWRPSGAAPVGSSTTSDWAFLGELPAVKVGPGDTLRSHQAGRVPRR